MLYASLCVCVECCRCIRETPQMFTITSTVSTVYEQTIINGDKQERKKKKLRAKIHCKIKVNAAIQYTKNRKKENNAQYGRRITRCR